MTAYGSLRDSRLYIFVVTVDVHKDSLTEGGSTVGREDTSIPPLLGHQTCESDG